MRPLYCRRKLRWRKTAFTDCVFYLTSVSGNCMSVFTPHTMYPGDHPGRHKTHWRWISHLYTPTTTHLTRSVDLGKHDMQKPVAWYAPPTSYISLPISAHAQSIQCLSKSSGKGIGQLSLYSTLEKDLKGKDLIYVHVSILLAGVFTGPSFYFVYSRIHSPHCHLTLSR